MCHRYGLQVDSLLTDVPSDIEMMMFLVEDRRAMLLCCVYWPQRQGNGPLVYLIYNLDNIMVAHNYQNAVIVGHFNQHLVMGAFIEHTVMHGLFNHVNFPTYHQC